IAVMITAVGSIHFDHGFFNSKGGFEYNMVLAVAALAIAFTGPGRYSLDAVLGIRWHGTPGGLFALAMGVIGGDTVLLVRYRHLHGGSHLPAESRGASVTRTHGPVTP